MEPVIAVLVGVLVAASVYLMLSRNVLRFLFGLILISNAANLTIFAAGRLTPACRRSSPAAPTRRWSRRRTRCRRRWC
jgi:multisubunit Na+/H+ antiporter MnhC subunit